MINFCIGIYLCTSCVKKKVKAYFINSLPLLISVLSFGFHGKAPSPYSLSSICFSCGLSLLLCSDGSRQGPFYPLLPNLKATFFPFLLLDASAACDTADEALILGEILCLTFVTPHFVGFPSILW